MKIMITSWNCQGDSLWTIAQSARSIINPGDLNIILIQEAGSLGERAEKIIDIEIAGNPYKAYFVEQEDADNKRCTTGILVDERLWGSYITVLDKCGFEHVRRPLVFCIINLGNVLLYISTIHTTANDGVSKKELLQICASWNKTCSRNDNCWVLMGDMNCDASELTIGDASKIAPNEPTQKSGRTLDYAIVSPVLEPYVKSFRKNCRVWVDEAYRNSDHLAVKICLDL